MTNPVELSPTDPVIPSEPRRSRTLLVVVVVVMAALAAGVSGVVLMRNRDSQPDVLSIVQAASSKAAAQPTMRATMEMRLTGHGVDVSSGGEFIVDTVHKVSSGTMRSPGAGAVRFVAANGLSYTQLPRPDAVGHHWVSVPTTNPAASLGGQDPLSMLKLLGNPEDVQTIGEEKVNGTTTTHYREKLDPTRFGDLVAKSGQFTLPPGFADMFKNGRIDLWLDGGELPRRMTIAMDVEQVAMTMKMEFMDYGKPVQVTLPAVNDVTALSSAAELSSALRGAKTG